MSDRLLLPGGGEVLDDGNHRDVMTVLAGVRPTFDTVRNQADRTAAAGIARLTPVVAELKEAIRELSQKVLTASARTWSKVGLGLLGVTEFVGVRSSLARSAFVEPVLSAVSLVIVMASLGAASWIASDTSASTSKRSLRIGFIALLVGGVAILRFTDAADSDEGVTAVDFGPALVLVAATLAPVLFGEALLRRLMEDATNRALLASREAQLAEAEGELNGHQKHVDKRFEAMAEHDEKVEKLGARLRLQERSGASQTDILNRVISRRRGR